jgi:hypothetical protein
MEYHYLTTSPAGFVQQLVLYVTKGYYFYVAGEVPEGKDPLAVDRKLLERYDVALSKWQRYRRRKEGEASVQYLRYGRFFVLVATHGRHRFFQDEREVFRSCKEVPIVFRGYSVSHRRGRTHVRIRMQEYRRLKEYFLKHAVRRNVAWWERKLLAFPFECYAPVRRQTFDLYRAVNRARKAAGLPLIDWRRCIRTRRRPVRPFDGSPPLASYCLNSGEADRSSAGTQLRKE